MSSNPDMHSRLDALESLLADESINLQSRLVAIQSWLESIADSGANRAARAILDFRAEVGFTNAATIADFRERSAILEGVA